MPPTLPLDAFEGQAWLGIVPFFLSRLRLRGLPPLPGLSDFPELNVRTYVTLGGKPGVYFFSLDAGNPLAVAGGRLLRLSYCFAAMAVRLPDGPGQGWVRYASRRLVPPSLRTPEAVLRARYRPTGPARPPPPGTLEAWLTERYCLYTVDRRGGVIRLEIHHPPWPLQPAQAELEVNTMTAPLGVRLPDLPPLLHYAHRQDMVGWLPSPVRSVPRRRSERREAGGWGLRAPEAIHDAAAECAPCLCAPAAHGAAGRGGRV